MKKIILASAACLVFFGCEVKVKEEPTPKPDEISVTPSTRTFDHKGGNVSVMVTSSGEWTLKEKDDAVYNWISADAVSGVDGDIVTFGVDPNEGQSELTAEYVFACGDAEASFTIHSTPNMETLTLKSEADEVLGHSAGQLAVIVNSSLGYREVSYSVSDGADTWLHWQATIEGDEDNDAKVMFNYDALEGLEDRSAVITVSGKTVPPVTVNVVQEAMHKLETAQEFFTADKAGETLVIPVTSNVEYKVEIDFGEGVTPWITVGDKTAEGIPFTAAALGGGGNRSATVTFTQTDAKDGETPLVEEITISQIAESIIKWAAKMTGNRLYPKWEGTSKPGLCNKFTLETLVKFNEVKTGEADMMTIMGIEDKFLIRAGDGRSMGGNKLMVAMPDGGKGTDFTFEANRWYHIAVVAERTDGKKGSWSCYIYTDMTVYVDGQAVYTGRYTYVDNNDAAGNGLELLDLSPKWVYSEPNNRAFWMGYSYDANRGFDGLMTEIRIWNRCLSAEEINATNHFYTVDPKSEGLCSYWKFTGNNGGKAETSGCVTDATGNGNHLHGELKVSSRTEGIEWVEVALPDK